MVNLMYEFVNTTVMKKHILILAVVIAGFLPAYFISSCSTVPISGRQQLNLLPESQLAQMGATNYDQFVNEHKLSDDQSKVNMVKNVGNKIAAAVEAYLQENDMAERLEHYHWQFNLVENQTSNAWAMPGGKIMIYTGILEYTQDEAGLATVMGHEIAHVIAKHGNERMSQGLLIQTGGLALSVAMQEKPEQTQQLFMTAYGLGATVGVELPYSRKHETEADQMGVIFMAMAGYNPREAIDFWQRMQQSGGAAPPEFLSTHPSHETRIENLKEFIPEAMKYYRQ